MGIFHSRRTPNQSRFIVVEQSAINNNKITIIIIDPNALSAAAR